MTPEEWQMECCQICSDEDRELFAKWTQGLPERKETTPYHSQAHCIRPMRMAYEEVQPVNILEIGFCLGHSASIWLNLGRVCVTSIDTSDREETLMAAHLMRLRFSPHFAFMTREHFESAITVATPKYDLAFIDGDHSLEAVERDIDLTRELRIPYVLHDDYLEHWGSAAQAITNKRQRLLWVCGNMALCKNDL